MEDARTQRRAIGLMLLGVACFPVTDSMVKWLVRDLPVGEVVWARYAFNFLLFGFVFLRVPPSVWLATQRPGLSVGSFSNTLARPSGSARVTSSPTGL